MTVLEIQESLVKLGFDPGPVDGLRGPKTTEAIKKFQKAYKLVADGIPGSQTQQALQNALFDLQGKPEPDKSAVNETYYDGNESDDLLVEDQNFKFDYTKRKINEIIVHCAATPEGKWFDKDDIWAWHKARGWNRIGYHYIILLDGTIQVGCPIGQIGIHVAGHNTGTIGVSYIGGVSADGQRAKDTRTEAQRKSLIYVVQTLANMYNVSKISGHNQYAAKACPSFDVRKDILGNLPGFKGGIRQ